MNIIFNPITKSFTIRRELYNLDDWDNSYLRVLREAEFQCRLRFGKVKADKGVLIKASTVANIQYFLIESIVKESRWVKSEISNSIYSQLKNECIKLISEIKKRIIDLYNSDYINFKDAKILTKGLKGKYTYHLDDFNRMVFDVKIPCRIDIHSVLFHYNDKVNKIKMSPQQYIYRSELHRLYNSIIFDDRFNTKEPLSELIDSLEPKR